MKGEIFKSWIRPAATLGGGAPKPSGNLEWHKQYDNVDGTGEMIMGLMLLAFGLLSYLQQILPKDSVWRSNGLMGLLFMYVILAAVLVPGYLLRSLIKKRITFPRTGYVASQLSWGKIFGPRAAGTDAAPGAPTRTGVLAVLFVFAFVAAVIAAIVVAAMATTAAIEQRHPGSTSPAVAIGFALYLAIWPITYAFFISRIGRGHPWKWLVFLLMIAGLVALGVLRHDSIAGAVRPVMLFVGGLWVLSGAATLVLYMQRTKSSAPETE